MKGWQALRSCEVAPSIALYTKGKLFCLCSTLQSEFICNHCSQLCIDISFPWPLLLFFCWFLPRGKGTEIWPSIAFRASWKQINWAKDANCKRWIKIWLILILPIHIRIPSYSRGKLIGPPRLRVESNNRCTFYTHRPARSPDHSKHAQKAQSICWLLQIWAAFSSCSKTLIVSWRWNARNMRRRIQVHWFIMVHIES